MGGIGGASPSRGGKMTQKFINTILKLHNDYRRTEGASNMKKLVRFFLCLFTIKFVITLIICLVSHLHCKNQPLSFL